jgi:ubiquinone/menaquinone biosynthesis C-methylase UbiE
MAGAIRSRVTRRVFIAFGEQFALNVRIYKMIAHDWYPFYSMTQRRERLAFCIPNPRFWRVREPYPLLGFNGWIFTPWLGSEFEYKTSNMAAVPEHKSLILDQFTRQAVPFSQSPSVSNQEALSFIVKSAGAGPEDTVLDVGCGPGLLVCAFAKVVRHATGIDLTPAMLDQARRSQQEQQLSNITWQQGDVRALPFADEEFSIVSSRFVFHHLQEPLVVLEEMKRVCRTEGKVVVADMAPTPEKADALNAEEILRDPSHVRALPEQELCALFAGAGLPEPTIGRYRVECDLDDLLSRSFPNSGDEPKIRQMFLDSIPVDSMDLHTRMQSGKIFYSFPVCVMVAEKR